MSTLTPEAVDTVRVWAERPDNATERPTLSKRLVAITVSHEEMRQRVAELEQRVAELEAELEAVRARY